MDPVGLFRNTHSNPFAVISSTAIPYAFLNLSPKGASGPVMGWGAPILSVSCATAGAAAATRSIPDARLRTRLRRMASASLHGDWVMGGETVESGRKDCQGWASSLRDGCRRARGYLTSLLRARGAPSARLPRGREAWCGLPAGCEAPG